MSTDKWINRNTKQIALFIIFTIGLCSYSHADLVGEAGNSARSTGSLGGNSNRVAGWQFQANQDFQITALGMLDLVGAGVGSGSAAGFNVGHSVTLWDTSGNSLASVLIPAGTGAEIGPGTFSHPGSVTGVYRYVELPTSIQINSGAIYVVSAHYPNVNDFAANPNGSASFSNLITYGGWRFSDGQSSHSFPTSFFSGGAPFSGANFLAQQSVPEPSMAVIGLFGCCIVANRRRRKPKAVRKKLKWTA